MRKLESLTIFFPFYNDAGTIEKAISDAYRYGGRVADKLEVIAIHGGNSIDDTWRRILKAKKRHKDLVIIDKRDNKEGYAVIKYGFRKASKKWVFYTDGDLQYDIGELPLLVKIQIDTGTDIVNGYKVARRDDPIRIFFGNAYRAFSKTLYGLPVRDLTCDFRLIRRSLFKKIILKASGASILLELILKLKKAGATFAEMPVLHHKRRYGRSTYSFFRLFFERIIGDIKVLISLYN